MQSSKITQFFKAISSTDSDKTTRETLAVISREDSLPLSSIENITSASEASVSTSALPHTSNKHYVKQTILIDEETSEDEDVLKPRVNGSRRKSTHHSKAIIIDEGSDSETTMENLSIRSPQKRRKVILDDEDKSDDSANETNVLVYEQADKIQDARFQGATQDEEILSTSEGSHSTGLRRLRKRSENLQNDEINQSSTTPLQIFSESEQSSGEEVKLMRSKRKVHIISDNEDKSDGEEWDVDKSAILEERTRVRKQSRYSEMLKVMKAGKERMQEYRKDIPKGPLDHFTSTQPQSDAIPNEVDFSSETNDEDSDEDDDFVVADDIIDGVKATLSQQETHELPAEFSTRYQNNTEGYFHVYFEYLMYRIVDPTYGHGDNIDTRFKVAINAVNRLIETCKDKVYSPVWKKHFTEDLETWPSADWKPIYQTDHDCDACMISGKGSTYSMTLFGYRYDEHYFPMLDEEPDQTSANLENADIQNKGKWLAYRKVRPTKDQYWLGSTCFNRARIYHALVHLKYDLSTEMREFVHSFDASFEIELSQPSQQKIDYLVNIMVETRLTDELWSIAKGRVNDALYFRNDKMKTGSIDVSSFFMDS